MISMSNELEESPKVVELQLPLSQLIVQSTLGLKQVNYICRVLSHDRCEKTPASCILLLRV